MRRSSEWIVDELVERIKLLLKKQGHAIVAIDGRCASGKTTIAEMLLLHFDCNVIHMDDFFLQPHQRTSKRYSNPGSNVDYERVEVEVIKPIIAGKDFIYQRFDCQSMSMMEGQKKEWKKVTIVEGAYSCHPRLRDAYDFRVFLTVEFQKQMRRIIAREGEEKSEIFQRKWIPLEERYIEGCRVLECCELIYET